MRRVTAYRIAISRSLSRVILGRGELLCALADAYQHPGRHLLNALFLDGRHCADSLDWEARQAGRPVASFDLAAVDRLRGCGL
jgi:prepilin-type processing-associated H-X9-DG protein